MKLVSTRQGVGRLAGDEIELLDLPHADVGAVIAAGALDQCRDATVRSTIPFELTELRAPIPAPPKVICIGINYWSHVEELRTVLGNFDAPEEPVFFFIPPSAVCGPADPIERPVVDPDRVDHECELAVVIGVGGKHIPADQAWSHVAGVTMANDVSARELQTKAMTTPAFELSHCKGFDTFKPMGPALVTMDEIALPLDIHITCSVNGTIHQDAKTSDLIFDVPACIAEISRYVTLTAGDVILTGSPEGVGFFSGRFLADGDVVEVTGSGIGSLRNVVTAES